MNPEQQEALIAKLELLKGMTPLKLSGSCVQAVEDIIAVVRQHFAEEPKITASYAPGCQFTTHFFNAPDRDKLVEVVRQAVYYEDHSNCAYELGPLASQHELFQDRIDRITKAAIAAYKQFMGESSTGNTEEGSNVQLLWSSPTSSGEVSDIGEIRQAIASTLQGGIPYPDLPSYTQADDIIAAIRPHLRTTEPVSSYVEVLEKLAQEYHRRLGKNSVSLPAWESDREDNKQWCRDKVIEEWLPVLNAAGVKYGD